MTSASRSKRDPARLAELCEQAREAQTAAWLERQLAAAPPLSQEQLAILRPILAPVLHVMRGA
jgi:hypothetical protein